MLNDECEFKTKVDACVENMKIQLNNWIQSVFEDVERFSRFRGLSQNHVKDNKTKCWVYEQPTALKHINS